MPTNIASNTGKVPAQYEINNDMYVASLHMCDKSIYIYIGVTTYPYILIAKLILWLDNPLNVSNLLSEQQ